MNKKTSQPILPALTAALAGALVIAGFGCAPKPVLFDTNNAPDTPHCEFMKDVCREARAFQGQYEAMSGDEKQDAKAVMNAYTQQCEDAREMCRRSGAQ